MHMNIYEHDISNIITNIIISCNKLIDVENQSRKYLSIPLISLPKPFKRRNFTTLPSI